MGTNKFALRGISLVAGLVLASTAAHADKKVLGGDELKALITGKTVSVTHEQSGKEWKMYFGADGKTADTRGGSDNWEVNAEGKHCTTFSKLKCAKVADLGDGTYGRLKPNGDVLVRWTKIEDGKHL